MLGSIDCMHWEWVNCPKSWHGQYGRGDKKYPTIILEAVASYDLWIWHAFFGVAGANNDITVLHHSPLFDDLLADNEPVAPYVVNGQPFDKGYYLADGIYPQWSTFVKSFTVARDEKNDVWLLKKKKRRSGKCRKDVEKGIWCSYTRTMAFIIASTGYAISEAGEIYICPQQNILRTWVDAICAILRGKQKNLRDNTTTFKVLYFHLSVVYLVKLTVAGTGDRAVDGDGDYEKRLFFVSYMK
ncbi:ALP1-like protein [Tanacetum coccineum]